MEAEDYDGSQDDHSDGEPEAGPTDVADEDVSFRRRTRSSVSFASPLTADGKGTSVDGVRRRTKKITVEDAATRSGRSSRKASSTVASESSSFDEDRSSRRAGSA